MLFRFCQLAHTLFQLDFKQCFDGYKDDFMFLIQEMRILRVKKVKNTCLSS